MGASQPAAADGAYQIPKSVRLNNDDSAHFSRTTSQGNSRVFTYATWFKLGSSGDWKFFTEDFCQLTMNSDWTIHGNFRVEGSSSNNFHDWAPVFRDHSAWYHLCFSVDMNSSSSASERLKLWINGKQITEASSLGHNSPAQYSELQIFQGDTLYLGSDGSSYMDGYLADTYMIDGLALTPAAFGSFDDAGNWNPKEFALPAPNTGVTWTPSSGGPTNPGNMFNGNLSNYAQLDNSAGTKTITTQEITVNNSLRVKIGSDSGYYYDWTINGTTYRVPTSSGAGWYDVPIPVPLTITSFTGAFGPSSGDYIYGWEVDGVILVDGKTDPTTRNNPNNGTTWSDYLVSSTGSFYGGMPATNAFNGNLSNAADASSTGGTMTFTPPSVITFDTLEMYAGGAQGGDQVITLTDSSDATTQVTTTVTDWVTVKSGGGTLKSLAIVASGNYSSIYGIRIDGHVLIDSSVDNSFHLKFNDTAANRNIGYSQLMNTPTGAQPMYGPGADDSAKSNLVLALPGYDLNDHSATIKGSGSNKTITLSNSDPSVSSTQSKFYGSAIRLDGNDAFTCGTSSDFNMGTGDFTAEGWFWFNSIGSSGTLMEWDNNVSATGSPSGTTAGGQWYFSSSNGGTLMWYQDTTNYATAAGKIEAQKWTHLAVVVTSGAMKMYKNGVEISSQSYSLSLGSSGGNLRIGQQGGTSYFNGYINDFRVYKGTAKYTSTFTLPTRNDFTVNNLTEAAHTPWCECIKYTGDGTNNRAITGLGFEPDFLMFKFDNESNDYRIVDRINGVGKVLYTTTNSKGDSDTNTVKSFDTDGFTVGTESHFNGNGKSIHVWGLRAGGAASSNTTGSITSQNTVNEHGNFSITTYTGNGTNGATVGIGLSYSPAMLWIKEYDHDETGGEVWIVWQPKTDVPGTQHTEMNSTGGNSADSTLFNSVAPTSTTLTLGTNNETNGNGKKYIVFAWGEDTTYVQALKRQTSSGSAVTQTTNWRPKVFLGRKLWSGGSDFIFHSDLYAADKYFALNSNSAGGLSTGNSVTFQSNGYEVATGTALQKSSGGFEAFWFAIAEPLNKPNEIDIVNDTPTNYEDDSGDVHGNFATWNPLAVDNDSGTMSFEQGNLKFSDGGNNSTYGSTVTTLSTGKTGKWYVEIEIGGTAAKTDNEYLGIVPVHEFNYEQSQSDADIFRRPKALGIRSDGSQIDAVEGTGGGYNSQSWGNTNFATGDTIGIALDLDSSPQTLKFYKNGTELGNGSAFPYSLEAGNDWLIYAVDWTNNAGTIVFTLNAGQRSFKNTPPSGYKALCSHNYPDLFSGAAKNDPSYYFDIALYTGTGATQSIQGFNFQPDFVWIKPRSATGGSELWDVVRGATKIIYAHSNFYEETKTGGLTAFNSDGFSLGSGSGVGSNTDGDTIVGWAWDAGTAANSSVDSCSQTVNGQWTNPTAGFSITSWEGGGGAGQTVAHGLGAKPDFFATKRVDGSQNWLCYHSALGAEYMITLDATDAKEDSTNAFNDTEPTNTLITYGIESRVGNSDTHITYAWTAIPGFSAFGSYSGGNDPLMVYTGFKPKFVFIKVHSHTDSWLLYDTERSTYNVVDDFLQSNNAEAEATGNSNQIDVLSNGFAVRGAQGGTGGSGKDYIYCAWAEFPFKTTRAT